VPGYCPICRQELWTDSTMMDPYFYRNHLARRYYLDHVNLKHKEFAAWDHRIQLIYGLVALTTAVSALLLIGALDVAFQASTRPFSRPSLFHLLAQLLSLSSLSREAEEDSENCGINKMAFRLTDNPTLNRLET